MATATPELQHAKVVSHQQWLEARKAFLAKEKEFTRQRDELSRLRRELPWEKVEKQYEFTAPSGEITFADLFDGRSQLAIYHFMLGPGWAEGCKSCSYLADHFDGMTTHLANRDVTFAVVSRAPIAEIAVFKKRMGWRFRWVSSFGNDFNFDYRVSFKPEEVKTGNLEYNYGTSNYPSEELPGFSTFIKDAGGDIFHTYSAYARGLDILVGTYNLLDMVPKGRDEDGLSFTMSWVRHHDKYDSQYFAEPVADTEQPKTAATGPSCCSGHE